MYLMYSVHRDTDMKQTSKQKQIIDILGRTEEMNSMGYEYPISVSSLTYFMYGDEQKKTKQRSLRRTLDTMVAKGMISMRKDSVVMFYIVNGADLEIAKPMNVYYL